MRLVKRRGVSEILGAIIIAVITVAMSVAYASYGLTQAWTQTASISDVLRASARAQRQLLTLSYYYRSGDGMLFAYIYNMGNEASTLKTVAVGSRVYNMSDPNVPVLLKNAITNTPINNRIIQPKTLVELSVTGAPTGQFDLLVVTEEGGIFVWRLSFEG